MSAELIRFAHIIGATVLIGTGAGIAFFMLMAHRSRDPALIAHVAGTVVIADLLFTASAVIIQPITGTLLAQAVGWPLTTPWILWSLGLYVFIGGLWLPVLWIQKEMRDIARQCVATTAPLPERYHLLFHVWFVFGVPAFGAILAIVWLMVNRPDW
jgi:uncharacterized membrane protein